MQRVARVHLQPLILANSGMRWHQLDHMQTICTSDNHSNTSSLIFTGRMLFLTPTNSVKALKAKRQHKLSSINKITTEYVQM